MDDRTLLQEYATRDGQRRHHRRRDFRQFRLSRTCGAAKNDYCRHGCERHGGQRFNLNSDQRGIELYGMDKTENSARCQRLCVAGGGHNDDSLSIG